ncbi:hypothetical protein L833_3511 [Mycobacteroides abscessus MAB_091912_2446]|uniref:Uncharacterized protein n=1 Tax=Mycobacteroides abscessus MAB_091912_2446 TaxID=1335414 RepID=A0A829M9M3_9MYCO|nr:hypothetical protein L833_3511 [Mycobacteroides abscessus MAB_091912_2446]
MLIAAIVTIALAGLLAALSAAAFLRAPHGSPRRMLAPPRPQPRSSWLRAVWQRYSAPPQSVWSG